MWRFTSKRPIILTGGQQSSNFLMTDVCIASQTLTNDSDDVGHDPGRSRTAVGVLRVGSASPAAIHDRRSEFSWSGFGPISDIPTSFSQIAFPLKTLCKSIPEKSGRPVEIHERMATSSLWCVVNINISLSRSRRCAADAQKGWRRPWWTPRASAHGPERLSAFPRPPGVVLRVETRSQTVRFSLGFPKFQDPLFYTKSYRNWEKSGRLRLWRFTSVWPSIQLISL